ncbi:zinc finger protein ZFP2-like isoform X2 [Leguminivora glycinivorella]|uniref:zinc finger protein ZFP2-like isoform X2 n=1 Tax=Leguminivora glycinivorella TaxID=1035111 RepID=UPI00200D9FDC|nr:zinc finger protein ZFP2-like isoform X2 [Leguminivora glycinivorella]
MMFSDDEIKEMPGGSFMRPGDEIISIRKVCLSDKYDKNDSSYNKEPLISNSGGNELDVSRSLFRDGFFPDTLEHTQARFAWTEEDGNIASLVSEPGFGTGQTFGKDLDAALSNEQEADTSSSVFNGRSYIPKTSDSHLVSSTSAAVSNERRGTQGACKVDKTDPRSRFHYVKYVKRHGRTVKLWECGICSREFQHQYTLMRHLPTHTDERNFHCDTCGKSFRQLSTLSQHRAIHSAERPYGCEVCNKTFNRVSTLISHRKTHSDVKPYKCHLCPKGFHQKGNLRNHLFTHTNERPYRCNICFKGFNQQSNLVCHKNKAHSEDANGAILRSRVSTPRAASSVSETQPDSTRTSVDQCEVSSSVGPYMGTSMGTSIEVLSSSSWTPKSSPSLDSSDWSNDLPWNTMCTGVIVDPIKTYHMGVALATRQTPFALLKPDNSTPVLVKVIDTKIPGGKQEQGSSDMKSAVQIRVPVVATVVPQIKAGGQLHLAVQNHTMPTTLRSPLM